MSNEYNDVFIENLQQRMSDMLEKLTPAVIADFERYLAEGDLEGAQGYVERLETEYGYMSEDNAAEEGYDADDTQ